MIRFVGAGPGAVDLITVRGAKALAEADVIVYAGSLVNKELLSYKKDACEVYNSAGMTLEEVIDIMIKADSLGKLVVRLHTGDPSIYGAIKEQMDLLDKSGAEYEVVPGVSSFLGAAAALNAEFTLPGVSQTVILTRMAGRTPVPENEAIRLLASHNSSMVIFLSASMTGELAKELISGGYEAVSPAAVVYKATWDEEKIIRTTVGELEAACKKEGLDKTALIFVGGFLKSEYERSKLYDPSFTHGFRKGSK